MTFAFICSGCGYSFEQGFKPNPVEGRPYAVSPLRGSDRDIELPCPSCGELAHTSEAATLALGGVAAYVPSPIAWCEANLPQFHAVDTRSTGRSDSRRRGNGVNRIGLGLPGKHGGMS